MKKVILTLMTSAMLFVSTPQQANAATEIKQEMAAETNAITQQEADALVNRLHEIKNIDKSELTAAEKKELRNEVISIKNQLSDHPVLVISGTTLLLIIIILILL